MSNVYLSDCRPPLFIDFGADVVKFCQNFPDNEIADSQTTDSSKNYTDIETLPTILGISNLEDHELEYIKKINEDYMTGKFKTSDLNEYNKYSNNNFKFETIFQNNMENSCPSFGWETIWGGKILNENNWKKILELIGVLKSNQYYFLESKFSDVPLVFTQHSLPFNELKYQTPKILETAFEELEAPFLLMCSQAMLNLFSYNHSSGIVVDLGESGTQITPVLHGYTDYNNSIQSDMMSGRNLSILFANYDKKENINANLIEFNDCYQAKFQIRNCDFSYDKNNLNKSLSLSYLYSYPYVFKHLFKNSSYPNFSLNVDDLWSFIYEDKSFIKESDQFNAPKSEKDFLNSILESEHQSLEKKILTTGNELFSLGSVRNFQKLSTMHMAMWTIERLIADNIHNFEDKPRIVFAGGIMNAKGLKERFKSEFDKILGLSKGAVDIIFCENNYQTNFAKGAQCISNLDKLGQLMISKQEYHENGKDNLAFNYI